MIEAILKALAERKARKLANLNRRGYDYAAGRLLEDGDTAIAILENQVDSSRTFGDYNEFDKGIERALEDFRELQQAMF